MSIKGIFISTTIYLNQLLNIETKIFDFLMIFCHSPTMKRYRGEIEQVPRKRNHGWELDEDAILDLVRGVNDLCEEEEWLHKFTIEFRGGIYVYAKNDNGTYSEVTEKNEIPIDIPRLTIDLLGRGSTEEVMSLEQRLKDKILPFEDEDIYLIID